MQYHSNYWYIQTTNGVYIRNASGSNNIELTSGGTGVAAADWRAPIFYDSDNTTYYCDPSSTGTSLYMDGGITGNDSQERVKYSVWDGYTYGIGMKNGFSYGHIASGEYCMTFQMNNNNGRGFWWGDDNHSDAQGAMSLSTNGKLTVATSISVGEGQSVTSPNSAPLYVSGGADITGDITTTGGHIYGKAVNNAWSNLYRFGGIYFTWDSDSYGTNFDHSITSTYNGTYGDNLTINSYGRVRINIDSNGNGNDTFEIGRHTTGSANTMLSLNESSQLTVNGDVRSPIFYDSGNTARYVDPGSTSVLGGISVNGTLSLNNNNIDGVNHITINDPGPTEGISWSGGNGWRIVECPDNMTTNSGGNLQFSTNGTRRVTVDTSGNINAVGNVVASGATFSNPVEGPSFGSTNSNVSRVMLPHGASYTGSGTVTGAFKIKLPVSWTNTMMSMRIVIYDYSDGESFEVQCGGYNHTGSGGYWVNMFGHITADPNKNREFNIRFGHDGSNCCIFIGETTNNWSYPKVVVTEFIGGHSGYAHSNWDNNWDITTVTSFPSNIDHTEQLNQIGRYADMIIDTNNTSRYLDLDGTSVLAKIHCVGSATNTAPRWDTSFHVVQSQHWYGHSSTQTMYLGESGNKTRVRGRMKIGADSDPQSGYDLSVDNSIHMNNTSIDYVNQLHFHDNVRFQDMGNDQYLKFKWGDAGAGGITFYDGNDTRHGYVYGDGSGGFGLLDKDGQWFLYTNGSSSTQLRCDNSVKIQLGTSTTTVQNSVFYVNNTSNHNFGTGGTGNIYVGGNTSGQYFRIHHNNASTYLDAGGAYIYMRSNNGANTRFRFGAGTDGGTLVAAGDVIAYGSPSDITLKENIKPIENALDKVEKLQGVTFDWKEQDITNLKEDIGFIAQDVQKVLPELVRENDNGKLSMRHQGVIPVLVEAIKELKEEIKELKKQIK
jgi:hypothetical protein